MDYSIQFPNLGLNLPFVPNEVQIGGISFTIYGLLVGIGALLGILFAVMETIRRKQDPNRFMGGAIVALIMGLIGARLSYCLLCWNLYDKNPIQILDIRSGGMTFYGGVLLGAFGVWIYSRITQISLGKWMDAACMGLVLAQAIGRFGDFFNRDCFGEYTNSIYAMRIPVSMVSSANVTALMRENMIVTDAGSYIQVHPVFLYESLWCLLILILLVAFGNRKLFDGELSMEYLALYGLGRCGIEYLRADSLKIPGTRIPIFLVLSAFLFVFFEFTVFMSRMMEKKRIRLRRERQEEILKKEEENAATENVKVPVEELLRDIEDILRENEEGGSKRERDFERSDDSEVELKNLYEEDLEEDEPAVKDPDMPKAPVMKALAAEIPGEEMVFEVPKAPDLHLPSMEEEDF